MAYRIGRGIRLRDRPVEQRNRIVALEIGRVGKDEVGVLHYFGIKGVHHDEKRNRVVALLILARQHLPHFCRIHARIPGHVGHEQKQRVDRIRIAVDRIGDHHVHQTVRGKRRFP